MPEPTTHPYETRLNVLFPALELIDIQGRSVTLLPRQGFVVPRGVVHRTCAPERSVVLMIETASIVPTGN